MAAATSLSLARPEHRNLSFWMDRVLKELQKLRTAPDPDAVHDLRVAIRHCRSLASVMEEVDPDPAWPAMRKAAKKLFAGLGELRDAQVLEEWVAKLGPVNDPVRAHLQAAFAEAESDLQAQALRLAQKFDEKSWQRLERRLRTRARFVPVNSLAAECLALARFEEARELHTQALRTEKIKPWHALRIGLKKFRYTVAGFLPEHAAAWSHDLKRVQDLLGDIHDLDVLLARVQKSACIETEDARRFWEETIARERSARMETYRQLTLGKTSLWNTWRQNLPTNGRLEAASLARLRATAQAVDSRPGKTAHISRLAVAIFDALRHAEAAPLFAQPPLRRIFLAAARLHHAFPGKPERAPQKAARKFVQSLAVPPGWSNQEWHLLGWTIRFHRGPEPRPNSRAFSELSGKEQSSVCALAGILRLARALRKCGVGSAAGFRIEKSPEALVLHTSYFVDSPETAARLAAGKHLLESFLQQPLLLKPAPAKITTRKPHTNRPELSGRTELSEPLRFAAAAGGN